MAVGVGRSMVGAVVLVMVSVLAELQRRFGQALVCYSVDYGSSRHDIQVLSHWLLLGKRFDNVVGQAKG